jgi:hypothetical protein
MTWFRFPENVGGISVAGQEFQVEVRDEGGFGYFRAPDHFAPQILDNEGFRAVSAPLGTDLPDLPGSNPSQAEALLSLQSKIDALEMERNGLRQENLELKAQVESLQTKPILPSDAISDDTSSNGKKK